MSDKNIFYLNKVYPEAEKIFSTAFKSAEEIIKKGIIILDTNILLIPFDTNPKSLAEIKQIFEKYRNSNRLFIPARVAREFANNRGNKIGFVYLQLKQLKDQINNANSIRINNYPILDNIIDYGKLKKEFEKVKNHIQVSNELLNKIESQIRGWTWDDPVSEIYEKLFSSENIIEMERPKEEMEEEINFRVKYKIAPGYKDSDKPDDGIGDLEIWQTILEISKRNNSDVIFVTNDAKNDWFHKQDKSTLYPRFELFDEFRRFTNGNSIAIIDFLQFLKLSEANNDTIKIIMENIEESKMIDNEFKVLGGNVVLKHYKDISTEIEVGMLVEHQRFGVGKVLEVRDEKDYSGRSYAKARIFFNDVGEKVLVLKYAKLAILSLD